MSAEQMFKELGYKKCISIQGYTDGSFEYIKENEYYVAFIRYDKSYYSNKFIEVELHKAITQQMKELHWIGED